MSKDPKCLFNKSTENVNTKIMVKTELGNLSVYVSDKELVRPISDVYKTVDELLLSMKSISDAFGIDMKSTLSNSDIISINENNTVSQNATSKIQHRNVDVPPARMTKNVKNIEEYADDLGDEIIEENVLNSEAENEVVVTSPNGRNFSIPTKIKDDSGDTTIVIDTESETNYNRINQSIENKSYKDGYAVRFVDCKLCFDNKSKFSTGKVGGKVCPKCKGTGEIMIS
jgi:hypothetical protein